MNLNANMNAGGIQQGLLHAKEIPVHLNSPEGFLMSLLLLK